MSDYDRIAKAIEFIAAQARRQPTLEEIAAHIHLSPYHFQRLFSRWAGITPKRFLQVLTLEHAKRLLSESGSLLEVSGAIGLSSSSRLHDHFVNLEAITPGDYKRGGAGLTIRFAVHPTSFGDAFVAVTPRGVCSLGFIGPEGAEAHRSALHAQWPCARMVEDGAATSPIIEAMLGGKRSGVPLSLYVAGTNFQTNVWRALLRIPPGRLVTYAQVAAAIGKPRAARAVGTAIGANPVALLIPCHRVIRESGRLAGYQWGGEIRKHAVLAWEAARHESEHT